MTPRARARRVQVVLLSRSSSLLEHDLRANAFRVCREGKPVSTFPDHALAGQIPGDINGEGKWNADQHTQQPVAETGHDRAKGARAAGRAIKRADKTA